MHRVLIEWEEGMSMSLAMRTAGAVFREETVRTLTEGAVPGMQWDLTGEGSSFAVHLVYMENGLLRLVMRTAVSEV